MTFYELMGVLWRSIGGIIGVIVFVVFVYFAYVLCTEHTDPKLQAPHYQPQAGYFMTSDILKRSFYITRMVDNDKDGKSEGICVIQPQIPDGMFENCVTVEGFYTIMDQYEGYITKHSKYSYY